MRLSGEIISFLLQKILHTKKNAKCKQGFHLDDFIRSRKH